MTEFFTMNRVAGDKVANEWFTLVEERHLGSVACLKRKMRSVSMVWG